MAWTIQYYADPIGNPLSFVEKQVNELGWGLSRGVLRRRSLQASTMSWLADAQDIDSDLLFEYGGRVVVWHDRIVIGTSFSGGSIYFQGVATKNKKIGTPQGESVQYTFTDLFYYLANLVYEQTLWNGQKTSHVLLNVDPSNQSGLNITMRQQVQAILDDTLSQMGSPVFTYVLTGLPALYLPSDEKKDSPEDQSLKDEMRWAPSGTTWVDYTQTPPVLHVTDRLSMSAVTVDIGTGDTVVNGEIEPLYELQVPQVIIRYEETNKVGDNQIFTISEDKYPPTPAGGTPLGIMRCTINLQGFSATEQEAVLQTQPLDATSLDYWKTKHPFLQSCTSIKLHDSSYSDEQGNPVTPEANEVLNDGAVHAWMTLHAGGPVSNKDVVVSALVDYTDPAGQIVSNEDITVKIKTTNAPSGTYTRLKFTQYAEPIPTGVAQYLYNILSVLQYSGEVVIQGAGGEVPSTQFLGKLINVTGGAAEWATMNALVTEVEEDLESGKVSVKFGANKYLSPGELIDLLKVTRTRQWSFYPNSATTGGVAQTNVQMLSGSARENSIRGNRETNKQVTSYTDPVTGLVTTMTHDAINQVLTISTSDPSKPQIQISLADI